MATTDQQATLDREFVEDFLHRYEEAWADRDPERIAAAFTEDAVFDDPALGDETLHGRESVRRFAAAIFRMTPDFVVESVDRPSVSTTRPRVLVPYRMSGTVSGTWEFLNLAPTGRRFEVAGVDSWEMRDGLIARYRTFYDALDMSRQVGFMPPSGSRAETAITRLQHVQARFQRRFAR